MEPIIDSTNVTNHNFMADTIIHGVKFFKDQINYTSKYSNRVMVRLVNNASVDYPIDSNTDGSVFTCQKNNKKDKVLFLECHNLNSAKISLPKGPENHINLIGNSSNNTVLSKNQNKNPDYILFDINTQDNMIKCDATDRTYISYWGVDEETFKGDVFHLELKGKEEFKQKDIIKFDIKEETDSIQDETSNNLLNDIQLQYHKFTSENNNK